MARPRKNVWGICQVCQKESRHIKKGYCKTHSPALRTGDKHWNWQGGITTEDHSQRVLFRRTMRDKVFARDNYTCQICNAYGVALQIDHIERWVDHPQLRFEMSNCRTVCMACHYYVTFKKKMPVGIVWGHNLSRRIQP